VGATADRSRSSKRFRKHRGITPACDTLVPGGGGSGGTAAQSAEATLTSLPLLRFVNESVTTWQEKLQLEDNYVCEIAQKGFSSPAYDVSR
jgi:hypothetical protein